MSTNWLLPTVLTCMVVLVVIGIGAAWFGISAVPKTRIEPEGGSTVDSETNSETTQKKSSGLIKKAQEKTFDVKEIESKIDSLDDIDET